MQKKLYRSRENRILGGVLGGVGEYLNIDPTWVRLLFVCLSLFSTIFPGVICYIIACFIVPERV